MSKFLPAAKPFRVRDATVSEKSERVKRLLSPSPDHLHRSWILLLNQASSHGFPFCFLVLVAPMACHKRNAQDGRNDDCRKAPVHRTPSLAKLNPESSKEYAPLRNWTFRGASADVL